MIYRSHAIRVVAILALITTCEASTISSSVLDVTRTRNTENHEEFSVRISVYYLTSDLTLGTTSHAIITSPGGKMVSIPQGSERSGKVSFSASFPLASLDDVDGTWSVTVNDGAQAHEDLEFLVPVVGESSFASYPAFPTPFHQGDSYKVFVPMVASGVPASASASGHLSSAVVTNGVVYTFPAGGPFSATSKHEISLPSIAVQTTGGQFLKWVEFKSANSYSTILVHTGPELHPFAGSCQLSTGDAVFLTSGLVPGQSYTLWRSQTMGAWEPIETFTAPSNVHQHREKMSTPVMFFRLESNP